MQKLSSFQQSCSDISVIQSFCSLIGGFLDIGELFGKLRNAIQRISRLCTYKTKLARSEIFVSCKTFNQIKGCLPKEKPQEAMDHVQRGIQSFWGCVFKPLESIKSYCNPKN